MISSAEVNIRRAIAAIGAAWREKQFDGLANCFHENAVIVGPGYATFASGREACADSYREFAQNASVLDYTESNHELRIWGNTAVYTFSWEMTYLRERGPKKERGTDQMVLTQQNGDQWSIAFRFIYFEPNP